jgi:hypothetical protein
VKVYAGTDPLTGREIRLRKTCKTERAAQIELGKLLEQASAGRQPETNATVAELMDRYVEVARKRSGLDSCPQLRRAFRISATSGGDRRPGAVGLGSARQPVRSARRITSGALPRIHGLSTDTTADRIRSSDCTGISRPAVP